MERINLPLDLIEEILSRVPTKSVARLRSTSKGWSALLKSWSFAKKHSANAPKGESLYIMLIDSRVCLVKINLFGFHHDFGFPYVKVAYEFNLKNPVSNPLQVDIRHVFHCDGLLLCTTKNKRLVVWNPCSGETKWIQPRNLYGESDIYALGYDNSCSSKRYKILRMNLDSYRNASYNEYEIYDFTSDSWRVLSFTDWDIEPGHCGVSLKGNSYWIYPRRVLSFDFSEERFKRVSLPRPFPCDTAALSVVGEEQLFLLGTDIRALHVWVTTSPGSSKSWSKFLKVRPKPMEDTYGELSFFADEKNKAIVYCQYYSKHKRIIHIVGRKKHMRFYPRDRNDPDRPSNPLLLNYVPSLAQIANCKPQSM